MTDADILKFLRENGNLELIAEVEQQVAMAERKKYLDLHPYKIYLGSDGLWRTMLPTEDGKKVYKRKKTKEELEDLVIEYWKTYSEKHYLKDMIVEWLNHKLEYEEIYKQSYDRYMGDFHRFIEGSPISMMDIADIDELTLEEFIRGTIRDKQLSSKAYGNMRVILRGTLKYAYKRKLIDMDVEKFFNNLDLSTKVFKKHKPKAEESVFTDKEVEMIETWIYSRPESIINYGILLAFYTGLRVGELSALQPSDINGMSLNVSKTQIVYKDKETGKYVFEVRDDAKTEAGNRTIILNDKAIDVLKKIRRMNPFGEYLFMGQNGRIKEKAFSVKINKICEQLGIPKRSMHKARKTYATKLINSRVDESLIINQMGHTNIDCTKNYYYYSNTEFDDARDQICRAVSYH